MTNATRRHAFLLYVDERAMEAQPIEEIEAAMASHVPYIERLRHNGCYRGSEALAACRVARTVRRRGGETLSTEGRFAGSREQFGGVYFGETESNDEALAMAAECPALRTSRVSALIAYPFVEQPTSPF